jgi:hypothetical protein
MTSLVSSLGITFLQRVSRRHPSSTLTRSDITIRDTEFTSDVMAESRSESVDQGMPFYCHECKKRILLISSAEDPICPDCQGYFLESLEEQQGTEGERPGRRSPTDTELNESLSWRLSDVDPSTGSPRNPMDDMHIVVNSLMEVGGKSWS